MSEKEKKYSKKKPAEKKGMAFPVSEKTELMVFLMAQMPHKSRNNIKSLLSNKQVFVEGKPISQFNHPLTPGQTVEIGGTRIAPEQKFREYTIVYEDQDVIVIDKAAGLLSMATDNEKRSTAYSLLSRHVKRQDPDCKIFIVHRLDRETSGLMLFAKSEPVKRLLQDKWNDTILERTYIAVVEGVVEPPEGVITSYLSEDKMYKMHSSQDSSTGQKAVTHYATIKTNKDYSLLKLNLETGRKNQIRVHMQDIKHSIVGDKKYGAAASPIKRLGLHAQRLSFVHPTSGHALTYESKIPRAFMRLF
jgi:23S rRNA pseudouridine1911/1915/1917 synthase